MKIQCSCGAKHEIPVVPEMATRPVRFVCSACGLDSSEFVNALIREELARSQPPAEAAPVGVLLDAPESPAAPQGPPPCLKHPGEVAADKCFVCAKPICPKCMELFGYLCSPVCKAKAEARGLKVPIYALQKSVVEARFWRHAAGVGATLGVLLLLLLGFWVWHESYGIRLGTVFSVRFPELSYSGQSALCGANNGQIVFLHGSLLARHDMKLRKEVWSRDLIDHKQIQAAAAETLKNLASERERARQEHPDEAEVMERFYRMPSPEEMTRRLELAAAAELALHVRSNNIWVASGTALTRYDWETGATNQIIPYKTGYGGLVASGDELLLTDTASGKPAITHINLASGEVTVENLGGAALPASKTPRDAPASGAPGREMAGLPSTRGEDAGKPMDPARVAAQARRLSLPARIALPAVLAQARNEERLEAEMRDSNGAPAHSVRPEPGESLSLIPGRSGYVEIGIKLLESRMVERSAMKDRPGKSVLNENINVTQSGELANEMLNDMQRERGGDKVVEDHSLYRVRLLRPDSEESWSGELTGPPALFPLQTVNVLAGDKALLVFDKHQKKRWDANLNYPVENDLTSLEPGNAPYGQGPCVERKDTLYIFDQGTLSAFDLSTGQVRWRLPSVGIAGLFFDDKDGLYVNTTSAGLDRLKYSRQIDISRHEHIVVLKMDCRTGKTLWRAEPGAMVNYVSGKFIYTVASYQPPDEEDSSPFAASGMENDRPFMRLRRLNPASGSEMWEHFQQRAPLDVQFDRNLVRLVFRKEVQVLKSSF